MKPNLRIMRYVPTMDDFMKQRCTIQLLDMVKLNQKDHPDIAAQYYAMAQNPDWVDTDFPHDVEVTEAIVAATQGFAVADMNGSLIAKFDSLADAEAARSGAKIELNVQVNIPRKGTEDF